MVCHHFHKQILKNVHVTSYLAKLAFFPLVCDQLTCLAGCLNRDKQYALLPAKDLMNCPWDSDDQINEMCTGWACKWACCQFQNCAHQWFLIERDLEITHMYSEQPFLVSRWQKQYFHSCLQSAGSHSFHHALSYKCSLSWTQGSTKPIFLNHFGAFPPLYCFNQRLKNLWNCKFASHWVISLRSF